MFWVYLNIERFQRKIYTRLSSTVRGLDEYDLNAVNPALPIVSMFG